MKTDKTKIDKLKVKVMMIWKKINEKWLTQSDKINKLPDLVNDDDDYIVRDDAGVFYRYNKHGYVEIGR